MSRARTRFGKPVERKSIKEFTRMQEKSNEDELAGLTVWFPDLSRAFRWAQRCCQPRRRNSLARRPTPAVISSVAILQTAAQRASVRVEGEGKLEARAARLQNPDRLVLDFSGARLGAQKTEVPGVVGSRARACVSGSFATTWCAW